MCEIVAGVTFDHLDHNDIVVKEQEYEQKNTSSVMQSIVRADQLLSIDDRSIDISSDVITMSRVEDLENDIRNLLYAFYDYDCFTNTDVNEHKKNKASTFSFQPNLELLSPSEFSGEITVVDSH